MTAVPSSASSNMATHAVSTPSPAATNCRQKTSPPGRGTVSRAAPFAFRLRLVHPPGRRRRGQRVAVGHWSFGGVKSAMYNWVGPRPSRLLVHITRVESGENTGSTSCPGAWVNRVVFPVSVLIQCSSM
jgi:hypothetical protein